MDEVEVIQNYLLSQAGEDTDVIMGLGYDNTLGSNIGITLIATGFKHKDPFAKDSKEEKIEVKEKVVFQLEVPKEPNMKIPVTKEIVIEDVVEEKLLTPAKEEETTINDSVTEASPVVVIETQVADPMMPTLKTEEVIVVEAPAIVSEVVAEVKASETAPEKIFFEISNSNDQMPTTKLDMGSSTEVTQKSVKTHPEPIIQNVQQAQDVSDVQTPSNHSGPSNLPSSGVFLVKPAQIYVQEVSESPESNSKEEPLPAKATVQEDEPVIEMQLVVKESTNAVEVKGENQTQPIMKSSVEEPALQDETEALRRRANERLAKLRNLSFNVNASDPNSEFENVPAYLRRNMEMQVQLADVETFYSNYTVKPAENNQTELSTINTFLDGKKPD
jgi:cell division protein FtsZ